MQTYEFYVLDTETTGLQPTINDIIELSIIRVKDDAQKTWFIKPINMEAMEPDALRINGHSIDDLKGKTSVGREKYQDPNKVIIEIENWLMEDGVPSENRCMTGHNVPFDRNFLEQLWIKCNSKDSYPFGRRYLDTMVIEMFLDYCKGGFEDYYNLGTVLKKYGLKNEKAHTASADTKATKDLFIKQVKNFKAIIDASK